MHEPIEESQMFREFELVAEWCWRQVATWTPFAKNTMGMQIVRAADSVGANLVEGDGRYSEADALHFFVIARASARETKHWLRKAALRELLDQDQVLRQ